MPDLREVYQTVTEQRPPAPGALERQRARQQRSLRNRKLGTIALSAGLVLAAILVVVLAGTDAIDRTTDENTPVGPTVLPPTARGWILYQDGLEFIAIDPDNRHEPVVLGASDGLDPIASSGDGSRLLLYDRHEELLYLQAADGSRINLTPGETSGWTGSISPDGRRVVFGTSDGLYVTALTGGAPTQLLETGAETTFLDSPAWSPDGSQIAFIRSENVDETSWGDPVYRRTLMTVSPDGNMERVLADLGREDRSPTGWAMGLVWSPDGSRFAFASTTIESRGEYQIYVVDADGSRLRRLTDQGINLGPVWAPDGSQIAFSCRRSPARTADLCTIPADGTDRREVIFAAPSGWPRPFVWTTSLDAVD
jgi:dipeptidyl aminopeptidase/acylaminoacyl peptidase